MYNEPSQIHCFKGDGIPYQNQNIAAILRQYCCNTNLLPELAYSESCNIAASGNVAAILQLLPEHILKAAILRLVAILPQYCSYSHMTTVCNIKFWREREMIQQADESQVCFLEFHLQRIDLRFI